jgi:hypothetical protein
MLGLDADARQVPMALTRAVLSHLPDDFEQVASPRCMHGVADDVDELRLVRIDARRQPQGNAGVFGDLEGVARFEGSPAEPAHELRKGREIGAGRRPDPATRRIGGEGQRERRDGVGFAMVMDAGDGRDGSGHMKIGRLQHAPHSRGGA